MTTVTLAQPRQVFTISGDTATDLELPTTPTVGNVVIALLYAEGPNLGYPNPPPVVPDMWTGVQDNNSDNIWIAAYALPLHAPSVIEAAPFSLTVDGAERLVVHLYEIEAPPEGFAYAFIGGGGGVSWYQEAESYGETAILSFSGFPLITSDIDMAVLVAAAFEDPLANTTTEPTITPDFGGHLGPATDGGRFATDFASVAIEGATKEWSLAWTGEQPDQAIFLAIGLMVDETGFARVQRKASTTSSVTLTTTPAVGNLLVATVGTGEDEVPVDTAGWNRIVGLANDDGERVCMFWREVATGQSKTISFEIENGRGISVEEWSGFLGSPEVSAVATGTSAPLWENTDAGAYATLLPPLPILDRIAITGLSFTGHPDGGVFSLGDAYDTGITGQRVYSGADASRLVSSYYPGLLGTYWENSEPLDAVGLVAVFSDSSIASQTPAGPVDPDGPFVFPDEGSRLAYTAPSRRGGALTSAKGVEGYVYLDAEGATLASITDLDGNAINGSLVEVGDDSKLPLFMGPGSATTLYVRWADSTVAYPIYARGQSAPVDYGVELSRYALLGDDNTFTGVQAIKPALPLLSVADITMETTPFVVIDGIQRPDGGWLSGTAAVRLDMSLIGGPSDAMLTIDFYRTAEGKCVVSSVDGNDPTLPVAQCFNVEMDWPIPIYPLFLARYSISAPTEFATQSVGLPTRMPHAVNKTYADRVIHGRTLGGKWALVGGVGHYQTPDIGPLDQDGFRFMGRFKPVFGEFGRSGNLLHFAELLTQFRNADGVTFDQDNFEIAIYRYLSRWGFFHEGCFIGTPFPVSGGEDAPSRIYSEPNDLSVSSPLSMVAGDAVEFLCEFVYDRGDGRWEKSFYYRSDWVYHDPQLLGDKIEQVDVTSLHPADMLAAMNTNGGTEDYHWKRFAHKVGPQGVVGSVADAGLPWFIGRNGGLTGIQYERLYHINNNAEGGIGDLILDFNTKDLDPNTGLVTSPLVIGQVFTPWNNDEEFGGAITPLPVYDDSPWGLWQQEQRLRALEG